MDLNAAREVYLKKVEDITDVVRFTATRFFLKDAIAENNMGRLKDELSRIRQSESLDILTVTDEHGRVIMRSRNPLLAGDSQMSGELVSRVISGGNVAAGTVIIPQEELLEEG